MDRTSSLLWLCVILAVTHPHPIDCIMTANVSKTMAMARECPGTCVCIPAKGLTRLTCSIGGSSGEEINSDIETILTNLTSDITGLSISGESVVDSVPMMICDMQNLEVLDLSSNSITDLPIGCLTNLKRLRILNLEGNKIETLERGTIEGLQKLEELMLKSNQIVTIDPEIFSNRSDLISLNNLDLSSNKIISVDAWIFIRSQVHPGCTVQLGWNNINSFTNNVGWNFTCGMKPLNMSLKLNSNPLQRVTAIVNPYIKNPVDILCMFGNGPYTNFHLELHNSVVLCDCQIYPFVRLTRWCAHAHEMEQLVCSNPFRGDRLMYMPVDQLLCEIDDQCPSGCKCTKQPSTVTINVDCANAGLVSMPLNLPRIKQHSTYRYNLSSAENQMKRLEYREYLQKTKSFDINHAGVTDIDEEVWRSFQYMSHVNLNGNKLKRIPEVVTSLNFSNIVLDIRDNPITCDCESRWLKSWLESVSGILQYPNAIICNEPPWLNGKSVLALDEEEFCSGPPYTIKDILEITIPSIGGIILLNFLIVYLSKRYRVQIYKYVKLHPFDRDECIGEDIDYDAFLSFSSKDNDLIPDIIQFLEKGGCKVCYPDNDFTPGELISENIIYAIAKSKRTICVLTRNFIESSWCMAEFRQSLQQDLEKKKTRLVVLLVDLSVIEMEEISPELRAYLSRYNYIEYQSKSWRDRLMYAMPVNRMKKDEGFILDDDNDMDTINVNLI